MTVLILGDSDDLHVEAVANHLEDYIILDKETIVSDVTISNTTYDGTSLYLNEDELDITSVYWREIDFFSFGDFDNKFENTTASMQLFFQAFPKALWCNPWPAFVEHQTKLAQYEKVPALKPSTLFTNNANDAISFAAHFDAVAVKPIAGGEYTKKLTKKKHIRKLDLTTPLCFQEYIEGTNVRTFVINDQVFAAEVVTDDIDFRTGTFDYMPIDLEPEHYQQCLDITKALGYNWTAIDWIRRNNHYYFLEANFSPMFLYFEQASGYPITQALADLLIQFNSYQS